MLLLKVLGWQGEHSVGDVASCPAGHGAGSTHVVDPSRLNVPSVQGVQSSADEDSLNVLTWQGTHVLAPKAELAFPASHGRQVSADVAEREELQVFSMLEVFSSLLLSYISHHNYCIMLTYAFQHRIACKCRARQRRCTARLGKVRSQSQRWIRSPVRMMNKSPWKTSRCLFHLPVQRWSRCCP